MQLRRIALALFGLATLVVALPFCKSADEDQSTQYLNHSDSAEYVGIDVCAQCHIDKVKTFRETGMGLSFDIASKEKSSAQFEAHHILYDSVLDFYYQPYWSGDDLRLKEYRLRDGDTVYSRTETISFIIGSGQHTNSHLIQKGDFVVQAPFTWYAQEGKLDFPPGFDKGNNSRFSRVIDQECMSCHNAMPQMVDNSTNAFKYIPHGIDCERCHGPGSIHVNYRKSGNYPMDGSIDYTIVNPSDLTWERQLDVCQRCHLQGNNVLKPGKTFADFRPGMVLSDVFEIFLPEYDGNDGQFNMANHSDRFQSSLCFTKGSGYTCISCHNPHVSVKSTNHAVFNKTCMDCHTTETCTETMIRRTQKQDDCVNCHMPSSSTEDIPHVSVHEHKIGIYDSAYSAVDHESEPIGLYSVNNKKSSVETQIKAYLTYYEKFDPKPVYRQRARELLNTKSFPSLEIHYAYQNQDWVGLLKHVGPDLTSEDAMTCYRIAKAYSSTGDDKEAANWLELAALRDQLNFKFQSELGSVYTKLKQFEKAEEVLLRSFRAYNEYNPTLNNLGYLYTLSGNFGKASIYLNKAIALNPDDIKTVENLVLLYSVTTNQEKEKQWLKYLLDLYPTHEIAQQRYAQLSGT